MKATDSMRKNVFAFERQTPKLNELDGSRLDVASRYVAFGTPRQTFFSRSGFFFLFLPPTPPLSVTQVSAKATTIQLTHKYNLTPDIKQ